MCEAKRPQNDRITHHKLNMAGLTKLNLRRVMWGEHWRLTHSGEGASANSFEDSENETLWKSHWDKQRADKTQKTMQYTRKKAN